MLVIGSWLMLQYVGPNHFPSGPNHFPPYQVFFTQPLKLSVAPSVCEQHHVSFVIPLKQVTEFM
jgi:hypothetical protein